MITEDWQETTIGEAFHFTKKPRGLKYADHDTLPFVPMDLIPIGDVFFSQYIEKEGVSISSGTYFEEGDLLLAKITPSFENGKQGIIKSLPDGFAVGSTELIPIKGKSKQSDQIFLFFFLLKKNLRNNLADRMQGSTGRQRLSLKILKDTRIYLPSLSEQHTIAKILQQIRSSIETRHKQLVIEQERRDILLERILTYGLRNESRKETSIGMAPSGWKIISLGEISTLRNGINFSRNQKGKGVLTVDVLNMYSPGICVDCDNLYRVDVDWKEHHLLKKNDILFVRSSLKQEGIGWPALFTGYSEPVSFCGFLIRTRINPDFNINTKYLINYLRYYKIRDFLISHSGKVAVTNISQSNISAVPVLVPSLEEQNEISELLDTIDLVISKLNNEVRLLEEFFQTILEELMSGRLPVQSLLQDS